MRPAAALERADQERERADRDRARDRPEDDERDGAVIRQCGQGGEDGAGDGAVRGDLAVLTHVVVGELREAVGKVVGQAEELDLLGRDLVGRDVAEVVELPSLLRPLEHERVADAGVVRLAQERGHDGHDQDGEEPGSVNDERREQGGERDQLLAHVQRLAEQGDAAHRLAPGALQLVVELRVLELLEIERRGVPHDADAHVVGEQVADQRFVVARGAGERVREQRDGQLEQHQLREPPPVRRRRADVRHHAVDDELADPEQDDRRERIEQPEREDREAVARTRREDHAQERRQVAQCGEPLADGRERLSLPVARLVEDGGHVSAAPRASRSDRAG